jgi:ATP-dependent RNA circularization protein (DNA/RNA ligase family)
MKRGKKENDYRVCSRNVVMSIPKNANKNFYKDSEGNVYLEMAEKYNMKDILSKILEENDDLDFVTIQGETYGGAIQKRNYSINHHDLAIFNVIFGNKDGSKKRLNPIEMKDFLDKYELPSVPVLGEIKVPNKCKEILELAEGESMLDKLPREGIVFRSLDGVTSFKAVSNSFLVKYHE